MHALFFFNIAVCKTLCGTFYINISAFVDLTSAAVDVNPD